MMDILVKRENDHRYISSVRKPLALLANASSNWNTSSFPLWDVCSDGMVDVLGWLCTNEKLKSLNYLNKEIIIRNLNHTAR